MVTTKRSSASAAAGNIGERKNSIPGSEEGVGGVPLTSLSPHPLQIVSLIPSPIVGRILPGRATAAVPKHTPLYVYGCCYRILGVYN